MTRSKIGSLPIAAAAILLAGLACRAYPTSQPRPVPPPANTIDPRVASQIESRLGPWLAAWKRVAPGWELSSFRRVGDVPFAAEYVRPLLPSDQPREKARLVACSPDGAMCVDPYITLEFDGGEPLSDVDGGVALIDRSRRTWSRLLYCGTPCTFDDALWIDRDVFVVVGSSEFYPESGEERCTEGAPCTYVALVSVFDLAGARVRTYQSPESAARPAGYLDKRLASLGLLKPAE